MKIVFNQDTIEYFANKLMFLEDSLRNEILEFVEANCYPEGTETYEELADELFNQVMQYKTQE